VYNFLNFALWGCLLLFQVSCTSSKVPPQDNLVVAIAAAPATLDPRSSTDANGMRMNSLIFQSILKIGRNLDLEGDAAEKWETKDKEFIFYLKPGLKFSNGRDITAEDILFSFEEYKKESCPFHSSFKDIEKFEVTQQEQRWLIKIQLKDYSAKFLSSDLPVFKILPKNEILSSAETFSKKPIGSGPFQLEATDSNQIILKKNGN
jgi:peptide/nickel transport system substrate-binding protein